MIVQNLNGLKRKLVMKDREFLIWLHERLKYVHGDSPHIDFMHKLRNIIISYPKDKEIPNISCANSLEDIK